MVSQTIVIPPFVRAASGDKVRLAAVGTGGKGASDIRETSKGQIVMALCDVDQSRAAGTIKKFPNARFYTDWRRTLEKEAKNIDGITVSTPDHMHAPVTMTALSMGLATYTQKPLTRTVYEARQLRLAAQRAGVATQMGNQGHSGIGYRMVVELIQRGVIGKVKEAHTWSNRPIWPQGLDRPPGSDPIPDTLDWDKWLGVAPKRPFKDKWPEDSGYEGNRSVYVPFSWRGWYDFGAGALGDMGCHIIDPVYWSLDLTAPNWVEYNGPEPKAEMFPTEETLTYEFPGTKYTDGKTNCPFAYAGLLTETVLLGVIASRVPDQRLNWNSENLRFTNSEKANSFVR